MAWSSPRCRSTAWKTLCSKGVGSPSVHQVWCEPAMGPTAKVASALWVVLAVVKPTCPWKWSSTGHLWVCIWSSIQKKGKRGEGQWSGVLGRPSKSGNCSGCHGTREAVSCSVLFLHRCDGQVTLIQLIWYEGRLFCDLVAVSVPASSSLTRCIPLQGFC